MSHSCFVSTITWFAAFTPDTLSVFIFRSLSRYARSCFARQLLRSLHSHSPAILWQMLRYVRQVFVGSRQIIKPLPCHLPHPLSNCQFPMPLNKKCATPAGAVSVRRPHASGSLLPPPSLHSLRLAPRHSAREKHVASLRSFSFAPFQLRAA